MPHPAGPVGPFPPGADREDYDRLRRRVLWTMTSGLYVLGTRAGERRNLMTMTWATQVATEPKLLAVAVEASAVTHRLLQDAGVFALSILARADRSLVRRFVKPAAWDPDGGTLNGVEVCERLTGAPVLSGAVAFVDCEVRHRVPLGSHDLFVGEVVDAGFLGPEDTPVLRTEDTRMSYGG